MVSAKFHAQTCQRLLVCGLAGYLDRTREKGYFGHNILDLFSLLDDTGTAFCIHDLPGKASPVTATGSFVYVRFHGAQKIYTSPYSDQELETWAGRLKGYAEKSLDVYAYFNNDIGGHAVENAKTLKSMLAQ